MRHVKRDSSFFFLKFPKPKRASYFIPSPEFYALQNS